MDSGNGTPAPSFPQSPHDLRSTTTCPYCFTPSHGASRCASCGLDLTNPRLAEVFALSTSSADLLTQRGRLLAELRAEQDAVVAPAAPVAAGPVVGAEPVAEGEPGAEAEPETEPATASAAEMPPLPQLPTQPQLHPQPQPGSIAGAWLDPSIRLQPRPVSAEAAGATPATPATPKRSGIQLAMLITGIGFLAVAAIVFVTVAFVLFDLAVKAIITAAITAGVVALASWLQHRKLTATAEGVAVLGVILLLLDAWAIPALGMLRLDRADPALYWGVALALLSALFFGWWRWSGLATPKLMVALAPLPALALLVAWAAGIPLASNLAWALGLAAAALASAAVARLWHREDPLPTGITLTLGLVATLLVPTVLGFAAEPSATIGVAIVALGVAVAAAVLIALWAAQATPSAVFAPFANIAAVLASVVLLAFGGRVGVAVARLLPDAPGLFFEPQLAGSGLALPFLVGAALGWRAVAARQQQLQRTGLVGAYGAAIVAVVPACVVLLQLGNAALTHLRHGVEAPVHGSLLVTSIVTALVCFVPLFARSLGMARVAASLGGVMIATAAAALPGTAVGAVLSLVATGGVATLVATRFTLPTKPSLLRMFGVATLATSLAIVQAFRGVAEPLPTALFAAAALSLLVARLLRPSVPGVGLSVFAIVAATVGWGNAAIWFMVHPDAHVTTEWWLCTVAVLLLTGVFLVVAAAAATFRLPNGEAVAFAAFGLGLAALNLFVLPFATNSADRSYVAVGTAQFVIAPLVVAAVIWDARATTAPKPRAAGTVAFVAVAPLLTSAALFTTRPLVVEGWEGWGFALGALAIFLATALVRRFVAGAVATPPTEYVALLTTLSALASAVFAAQPDAEWPWAVFAIACATPLLARAWPDPVMPKWAGVAPWLSAGALAVLGPWLVAGEIPEALSVLVAAPTLLALVLVAAIALARADRYRLAALQAAIATALALTLATGALLSDWRLAPTAPVAFTLGAAAVLAALLLRPRGRAGGQAWPWLRVVLAAFGGLAAFLGLAALALQLLDGLAVGGTIAGWLAATVFVALGVLGPLLAVAPVTRILLSATPEIAPELRRALLIGAGAVALLASAIVTVGIAAETARPVDAVGALFGVATALATMTAVFGTSARELLGRHTLSVAWLAAALVAGGAHAAFVATDAPGPASQLPLVVVAVLGAGALVTAKAARPLLPLAAWLVLAALPLTEPGLGLWWPVIAAGIPAVAVAALTLVRFRRDAKATPSLDLLTLLLPLVIAALLAETDLIKFGLLLSALAGLVAAFSMTLPRDRTAWGPIARAGTTVASVAAFLWLWPGSDELLVAVPIALAVALFLAGLWLLLDRAPRANSIHERGGYALAAPIGFAITSFSALAAQPLAAGVVAVGAAAACVAVCALAGRRSRSDVLWACLGLGAVSLWTATLAVTSDVAATDAWVVQPLCLAAIAIGAIAMRSKASIRSWPALGIQVIVSLAVAITAENSLPTWWRIGLATMLIVAAILTGALLRLQAPLLIGIVAAVLHVSVMWRMLLPPIAIPWWTWLAAAGILLVFVAATYEARLRDARKLAQGIKSLR